MKILPNGVAVCGKTHHTEWCATEGLVHDKWMAGQICKHLKPGDVVIEGGAHIGTLTRAMLDAGAQVLAFEPNPEAWKCLKHNCPEAVAYLGALGEGMGEAHIIRRRGNAGTSSLVPGIGTRVLAADELRLNSCRLIKLDIEGYEVKALEGATKVIHKFQPVLVLEVNKRMLKAAGDSEEALLKLVEHYGYEWEILQPECKVGDWQYDIVAKPIRVG